VTKPISIHDIARAAGVSHTTVSRALRDSPLISADVRRQIQSLAAEMGYIPNAVAQSLRRQQSNTVGLVVTTIADPFVGRVVRGVEDAAQRHGMSVFLSESQNNPERELAVIEMFHHRRVDGIIVAAALLDAGYEKRLERIRVPTILINQQAASSLPTQIRPGMLHSVSVADYSGACRAVEHLLSLGHRSIGYLGAGSRPRSNRIRQQAYRDAMSAAGLPVREGWICIASPERKYHTDDVADGRALLPKLVEAGVTGVFCYNDMIAVGALMACRDHGLDVPGQVSIVGFDDIEIAQYVTPALTTVHQPKLRLGQVAMQMLLQALDGQPVDDPVLPTDLVVRTSTARPYNKP